MTNDDLIPSTAPEPVPTDPVIALPPDLDPTPVPEPDPTPVLEVISVDELLERLIQSGEPSTEDPGEEEPGDPTEEDPGEEEPGEPVADEPGEVLAEIPPVAPDPVSGVVEQIAGKLLDVIVDLGRIEKHTAAMEQILDHPALTTTFAEYTVTESLLLLLLLSAFIAACARMLRGGLSWLRS